MIKNIITENGYYTSKFNHILFKIVITTVTNAVNQDHF